MIIFVHIPKTAGVSVKRELDAVLRAWGDGSEGFSLPGRRHKDRREPVPKDTECIYGHFPAWKYDAKYPGAYKFTFMRNPVDRVISAWRFSQRGGWATDDKKQQKSEQSRDYDNLLEFAERSHNINLQSKFIGDRGLQQFNFVGITELFYTSIKTLFLDLGIPADPIMARHNVNPNHAIGAPYDDVPIAIRNKIHDINSKDAVLYAEASDLLISRIKS